MGNSEILIQLLIGLAVILLAWIAGLAPKLLGYLLRRHRQAQISKYITATSFDENEILESLSNYVKPQCMDQDPACKPEMRDALSFDREDIFHRVDRFIKEGKAKHLFIFADCGMGKTSFLINYFHRNRSRRLSKNKVGMVLVSLSRASAQDEIERVPRDKRKSTVLLLDALDEDPLVFGNIEDRLNKLLGCSDDFKAVVVTCRSQFFLSDEEIPVRTGILRTGPTKASSSKEYEIAKLYVSPFDDRRIGEYLRKQFPGVLNLLRRKRAGRIVGRVPSLSVRPMLLAHIADVLAESPDVSSQADIYQAMVSAWVKREDRWIKPKPLLDFSRMLALDLYTNRHERGGEYCPPSEISRLASVWGTDIKAEHLTGRSLLNRLSDGNFKFSHRSILEFFVAESIVSSPSGLTLDITDQMAIFFMQRLRCADGRSEEILARRSLMISIVSPESMLGHSTNYGLYRTISTPVSPVAVFGIKITSDRNIFEPCVFGEHLQRALIFAEPSRRFSSVRLIVPCRIVEGGYTDAYLSIWFDNAVVLSRLRISSHDLASALAINLSDVGEICLSGVLHAPSGGVESIRWTRQTRCDLWGGESMDIRTLERCPAVSFLHQPSDRKILISFISGGERVGPLGEFGIVSGGSSLPFETQRFLRMHKAQPAPIAAGVDIPQLQPSVPAAERWPTERRRK